MQATELQPQLCSHEILSSPL